MFRKIVVLFLIGFCIKCQSHPHSHGIRRRAFNKRTLAPEITTTTPMPSTNTITTPITPTTTTTITPTTPLSKRTPIPKRKPEIGANPVSSLGDLAAPELQWHATIYEKTTTPYRQICGGTLVTKDFVISAAHCFWGDDVGMHQAGLYAVAVGKLLRSWDSSSDTYAQKSDIKAIHIPARFRGGATNFQADIAVLHLSSSLEYAPGVKPACVSFDPELEKEVLRKDSPGTITGFGLIEENGGPSPRLTVLDLPYIEIEECFRKVDPSFVKYLTSDKMCAGYWEEGKALCRGDSGGGLIYTSEIQDSRQTAPYLLGIASTAQRDNNQCNAYTPASFTHLAAHRSFLEQLIPSLEDECRYVYIGLGRAYNASVEVRGKRKPVFSAVSDSTTPMSTSRNPSTPSTPITPITSVTPSTPKTSVPTASALEPPVLEWYAAIYNKSTTPYSQICGASVVKRDVVISAAHCFWGKGGLQDASLFKVAAGKLVQSWDAFEDRRLQQESDVASIQIPPRYEDATSNYQGDLAVVRLRSPLSYSAAVRPVCVSFNPELDKAALCHDCHVMTTGWALSNHGRLRYVEIPVTGADKCRDDIDPEFRRYVGKDKLCIGFMSTAQDLCNGDIGGGLVRYSNFTSISVPFLHGVGSTMERDGNRCDIPVLTPASFTHVFYRRDFLEANIPELEEECRYAYLGEKRPEENVESDISQSDNGDGKNGTQNATTEIINVPSPAQPSVQPAPETSSRVLVTVHNGTVRVTLTAANAVTLEIKP